MLAGFFIINKDVFMGIGKWITGGLGYVMGGPIGAVVGYIIGTMLFEAGDVPKIDSGNAKRSYDSRRTAPNDFLISLLVLIAAVMKADGKVLKSELDVVKSFLLSTYGESKAKDALLILRDVLKKNYDVIPIARQIAQNLSYSGRLEMLHLMFDIANADNDVSQPEILLIKRVASAMGISDADYMSIASMFSKTKAKSADWAYDVLEISRSASADEVKKAYRRMAMKYHPDKVNTMGEEVKRKATEKFRAVNEAYNAIKTERGMA